MDCKKEGAGEIKYQLQNISLGLPLALYFTSQLDHGIQVYVCVYMQRLGMYIQCMNIPWKPKGNLLYYLHFFVRADRVIKNTY